MAFYDASSFEADRSIGYLIRMVNQAGSARLEPALAPEGISYVQWQVLVSIYLSRGPTCAALARDLAHDRGAMTRLVDGLEERGLVKRLRNRDDRRVFDLFLTEEGREITLNGRSRMIDCWNGWLDGWDPAEVDLLIGQLQRLRRTIETAPGRCA